MARDENGVEEVVPTVTLARLYVKQGLLREAAAVYKALLRVEPGQEALKDALRDMERRLGGQEPWTGSTEAEKVLSQLERWQKAVWAQRDALGQQAGAERKPRVLVVLGPEVMSSVSNSREDSPGSPTPEDIEICVGRAAEESGMVVDLYRAVDEEALLRGLREATNGYDVLIVEPGQSGCTAPATKDALAALNIPIIEVHLLNVFRGGLSHHHGIADVTTAHLAGFGIQGYAMAVRAAAQMARQQVV